MSCNDASNPDSAAHTRADPLGYFAQAKRFVDQVKPLRMWWVGSNPDSVAHTRADPLGYFAPKHVKLSGG